MALENAYRVRYGKGTHPVHSGWVFFTKTDDPNLFWVFDQERGNIVRLRGTNRMRCAACGGAVAYGDRVLGCSGKLCQPYELPIAVVLRAMKQSGVWIEGLDMWDRIKLEQIMEDAQGRPQIKPRREPDTRLRRYSINN